MLDVSNVSSIGVTGQRETIGTSNSIETKPLSLLLLETDPVEWLLETQFIALPSSLAFVNFLGCTRNFIALALLSDSLGQSGLRDVAESVRQRWPKAKILVLGRAVPALDDPLYDDEIRQNSQEIEIRDVIKALIPAFPGHASVQWEMD